MKKYFIVACIGSLSFNAVAGPQGHHDFATVTRVQAIYDSIERRIPEQHCWTERVREENPTTTQRRSTTGTLIGGLIGGAIGHEVGHGNDNKKIAAVIGSVLGMSIANDVQSRNRQNQYTNSTSYRDIEHCETKHRVYTEQILNGYHVDYRYRGRHYSTIMAEHPGDKIRVTVDVRPAQQLR